MAVLVIAGAIVGWLVPLGADATQLVGAPMAVFGAHPGGILLGLAVLRGTAHVKPEDDERIAEIALGPGLGFVALIWAMLTISGGTQERSTVDAAFAATVTFITAALLSMGLARVVGLRDAGDVGAGRRTWIGVLVAVMAVMLAVAMPLALIVGVPLDQAIRGALGPIGDLLVPIVEPAPPAGRPARFRAGLVPRLSPRRCPDRRPDLGWRHRPARHRLDEGPRPIRHGGRHPRSRSRSSSASSWHSCWSVASWDGRSPRRSTVTSSRSARPRARPVGCAFDCRVCPPARRDPVTADRERGVSGEPRHPRRIAAGRAPSSETPTEHARRLRADPVGPTLGRLAADYALVEFGRRRLTPSEDRRAVERWQRVRAIRKKGE